MPATRKIGTTDFKNKIHIGNKTVNLHCATRCKLLSTKVYTHQNSTISIQASVSSMPMTRQSTDSLHTNSKNTVTRITAPSDK